MEQHDDTVPLPRREQFVPPTGPTPPSARRLGRSAGRRGEQLAVLSLAVITGVIGFAVGMFWVISLILMGTLWGMLVMERQHQPGADKGMLAEMVDVVVDEATDFAEMIQRRIGTRTETGGMENRR